MRRLFLTFMIGGLSIGLAVTPQDTSSPSNPNLPGTMPAKVNSPVPTNLSLQDQQKAAEYYKQPKIISDSMIIAVRLIMDEQIKVVGMTASSRLPQEIITALERAAIHTPVLLAVGGGSKIGIKNVTEFVYPQKPASTIIATEKNTIVIDKTGKLQIWESQFQADILRKNLEPFLRKS